MKRHSYIEKSSGFFSFLCIECAAYASYNRDPKKCSTCMGNRFVTPFSFHMTHLHFAGKMSVARFDLVDHGSALMNNLQKYRSFDFEE